jgi:hypothetical protein
MPEASLFGTQMLEEPVPASEITQRISRMVAQELMKEYRFILMRPEEGYIFMVSIPFLFFNLASGTYSATFFVHEPHKLGHIQSSMPPVPEDREV